VHVLLVQHIFRAVHFTVGIENIIRDSHCARNLSVDVRLAKSLIHERAKSTTNVKNGTQTSGDVSIYLCRWLIFDILKCIFQTALVVRFITRDAEDIRKHISKSNNSNK